ncbi:MAG: hypothetical protein ACON49_09225, partial [Candidatus Puniceispirillaceae bacterium]
QQGMAPQAMMQQGMAPQAPLTADSAPPAGFPFATQPSDEAAEQPTAAKAKKGKLTREEKRAAAAQKKAEKEKKKAEKLATAKEKAEEKKRAKRRKKLAKTRFSRARYLREANGNAIAGVVLWIFMILIFIIGPFMLNTAILIPQTNENLRILSELESLKRSIVTNRPQIAAMAETRKARRGQITAFTSSFVPRADAAASLEELAQQLEAAGLEVKPLTVAPFPLVAQAIIGTSVNLEVTGSYVDWLLLRNKFIRSQRAISIPTESIAINPETGLMEIRAQIILPSSI